MPMTLVQSTAGGTVSGTNTSPFTLTTSAAGFSGSTTAGNMLVLIAYAKEHSHSAGQVSGPALQNPVTSGITWTSAVFNGQNEAGLTDSNRFHIWYAANAPSISPSVTTTVDAVITGTGFVYDLSAEFDLYEFSGIPSPTIDTSRSPGQSSGTPQTSNLPTTATDLIIVAYTGDSGNISAGSGYTLGINASLATTGQMQYQLNVASGSIATAFSGSQTTYGAASVAFKPGAVPPTITPQVVPSAINAGQSAVLSWTSTNATTVTIDNGIGSVATNGSMIVNPTVTTTYNFTANGPGGTALGQATLAINPSICNFDLQKMILSVKESNIPVRGRNQ